MVFHHNNVVQHEFVSCRQFLETFHGDVPTSDVSKYSKKIEEHLFDQNIQERLYQNKEREIAFIASNAFGKKISDKCIEATLRWWVIAENNKIACYAAGILNNHSKRASPGYWVYFKPILKRDFKEDLQGTVFYREVKPYCAKEVKPFYGTFFTKVKLKELFYNMETFNLGLPKLPKSLSNESEIFNKVTESLRAAWREMLLYPYCAKKICPLDAKIDTKNPGTLKVMNYLTDKKVIASWTVNMQLNTVHVEFDPSLVKQCVSFRGFQRDFRFTILVS